MLTKQSQHQCWGQRLWTLSHIHWQSTSNRYYYCYFPTLQWISMFTTFADITIFIRRCVSASFYSRSSRSNNSSATDNVFPRVVWRAVLFSQRCCVYSPWNDAFRWFASVCGFDIAYPQKFFAPFLPLHVAIAMERWCHRMTSVRPSVCNVDGCWSHTSS